MLPWSVLNTKAPFKKYTYIFCYFEKSVSIHKKRQLKFQSNWKRDKQQLN